MAVLPMKTIMNLGALFLAFFVASGALLARDGRTQSRIEKRTYDFKEAGQEMEYALFVP